MNKYKEDLDQSSPNPITKNSRLREKSYSGPSKNNDFNTSKLEDRHNPMVNPLPYNLQNPYIIKEMKRKQEYMQQSGSPYSQF